MAKKIEDIRTDTELIRQQTVPEQNTAQLVGGTLTAIVDKLAENESGDSETKDRIDNLKGDLKTTDDKLAAHIADKGSHVSAEDREHWNTVDTLDSDLEALQRNYADLSDVVSDHTHDTTVHVTAGDKETWNGHVANADIHVTQGDKSAWNDHVADADIHVTQGDKSAWNGHVADTDIHVTAEQKEQWDAVGSITLADADTLKNPREGMRMYRVTRSTNKNSLGLGFLMVMGDSMGHGVTQVLFSNFFSVDGKIGSAHKDGSMAVYYRYCHFSGGSPNRVYGYDDLAGEAPKDGEWTKWYLLLNNDLGQDLQERFANVWNKVNGHVGDTGIHVTQGDKSAWNGHVADTDIHVTAEQKEQWDAVGSITLADADTLKNPREGMRMYRVTRSTNKNSLGLGFLMVMGDSMGHGVTQVLFSNFFSVDGKIGSAHKDGSMSMYYRYCHIDGDSLNRVYGYDDLDGEKIKNGEWTKWYLLLNNDLGQDLRERFANVWNKVNGHVGDTGIHVTQDEKDRWNARVDETCDCVPLTEQDIEDIFGVLPPPSYNYYDTLDELTAEDVDNIFNENTK